MVTYRISKKNIKKLPVNSDTVNIIQSILDSGKYTVSDFLEESMYQLLNKYDIFYTMTRSNTAILECGHGYDDDCLCR